MHEKIFDLIISEISSTPSFDNIIEYEDPNAKYCDEIVDMKNEVLDLEESTNDLLSEAKYLRQTLESSQRELSRYTAECKELKRAFGSHAIQIPPATQSSGRQLLRTSQRGAHLECTEEFTLNRNLRESCAKTREELAKAREEIITLTHNLAKKKLRSAKAVDECIIPRS